MIINQLQALKNMMKDDRIICYQVVVKNKIKKLHWHENNKYIFSNNRFY